MSLKKIFNRRAMKRIGVYGLLLSTALLVRNYNTQLQWGEDTSLTGKVNRVIQMQVNYRDCSPVDELSSLPEDSRRHKIGDMLEAFEQSPTGKQLVDFARKTDVRFCERPITDEGGVFNIKLGVSGINVDLNDPRKGGAFVLAHELFHPVQNWEQTGKLLNGKDRILQRLMAEGAADVTAIRVAHELKERGDMIAWEWQNARLPQEYKFMQAVYDGLYQAAVAQGKSMDEAEDAATRATYRLYFSEAVVGARMLRIQNVISEMAHYPGFDLKHADKLTLDDMRHVATLPNGFDYVGDAKAVPNDNDIDGGLILVRQAVNAAYAHYHGLEFDKTENADQIYGIFKDIDMDKAADLFDNAKGRMDMITAMIITQGYKAEQISELIVAANDNAPPSSDENAFRLKIQVRQKQQQRPAPQPFGFKGPSI